MKILKLNLSWIGLALLLLSVSACKKDDPNPDPPEEESCICNVVDEEEPVDDDDCNSFFSKVVLTNPEGNINRAGIDLDYGISIAACCLAADIIDAGDGNNGNWLKQIKPVNGCVMRKVAPEWWAVGFLVYEDLTTDRILEAWDRGEDVGEQTETIKLADSFIIQKGNDYYAIDCTLIQTSVQSNDDKFEFSIKQACF